ncbi:hypothetical protein EST38_g11368 [Candolleomyces aberdarensis]|uniref:Uncharacterized protein n=1 Tax=Candolleomyces aberdarensis TaxID=2316362 RepID=A0A4Q2D502_9AGAR|nr:hypothetical protein EST38_g11368 [Candolleomyces aberdarensis]
MSEYFQIFISTVTHRNINRPPRTQQLGRGIMQTVDLFEDIEEIVRLNDEFLDAEEENESSDEDSSDEDSDDESKREERQERRERQQERRARKRTHHSFKVLHRLIPGFQDKIDTSSPEELTRWYKDLQQGTSSAHNWGLQHDLCGKLLSPIDLDWDDLIVRANIRNFKEGFELSLSARALYANYTGDAARVEKGYLKSKLLVKTYKSIFTSPLSAEEVDLGGDSSNKNTDRLAVRRRTSSKSSKSVRKDVAALLRMDNQGYKEDDLESKKMAQELLRWWNNQVFPEGRPTAIQSGAKRSFDALEKQRAARKRQRQPAAQS